MIFRVSDEHVLIHSPFRCSKQQTRALGVLINHGDMCVRSFTLKERRKRGSAFSFSVYIRAPSSDMNITSAGNSYEHPLLIITSCKGRSPILNIFFE